MATSKQKSTDKNRGGSVRRTVGNQPASGGSIPASPLYVFKVGEHRPAYALMLKHHYSGRSKRGGRVVGSFHLNRPDSRMVAACVIHEPSCCWRERGVLELHRLVRSPRHRVPLSQLISLTVREVKRRSIGELIVSYADSTFGHHGGVYQASGWNYHGKRRPYRDGVIVRGKFVPSRSANTRWGSNNPKVLRLRGIRAKGHFDKGKHLYWKALSAEGEAKAARLGLQKNPYPKPRRQQSRRTC
jgi:hypothetical protein